MLHGFGGGGDLCSTAARSSFSPLLPCLQQSHNNTRFQYNTQFHCVYFLKFLFTMYDNYEVVLTCKNVFYTTRIIRCDLIILREFLFYRQLSMKVIRCVTKDGAHNLERTKNGILLKQFSQ